MGSSWIFLIFENVLILLYECSTIIAQKILIFTAIRKHLPMLVHIKLHSDRVQQTWIKVNEPFTNGHTSVTINCLISKVVGKQRFSCTLFWQVYLYVRKSSQRQHKSFHLATPSQAVSAVPQERGWMAPNCCVVTARCFAKICPAFGNSFFSPCILLPTVKFISYFILYLILLVHMR